MLALHLRTWCCLLALFLCACGGDTARIEIVLNNLPVDAESLVFELRPQGLPSRGLARLEGAQVRPRIELTIANGLHRTEILYVRALDSAHCRIAEGQVQLSPSQNLAQVDLTDTRATACLMRVSHSGSGRVELLQGAELPWVSRVENQDLQYAEYRLPSGDAESLCRYRVRLGATAASDSYFVGWSLGCSDIGDCEPWGAACSALAGDDSAKSRLVADGLTAVHASFVPLKQCSPSGFCWLNPQPHGFDLNAVTGLSPRDGWAVGDAGVVMRYNGNAWATLPASEVGTTAALFAAWMPGPNNLWLAGEKGTVLQWDGRRFVRRDSRTVRGLRGVWGDGQGTVWVVGLQGTILKCSEEPGRFCAEVGTEPSARFASLSFAAVFGLGADDVYLAAGETSSASGVLLHWNGQVVTELFRDASGGFISLWGELRGRERRLWLGTADGRILTGNGSSFSEDFRVAGARIQGLAGRPAEDGGAEPELWAVSSQGRAYRRGKQGWQEIETTTADWLLAVWVNDREVWVAGTGGLLARWNGTQFVPIGDGKRGLGLGRALTATGELYLTLADSSLLYAAGGFVANRYLPTGRVYGLLSVDNELLAVSGNSLLRYQSGIFLQMLLLGQTNALALSGTRINDLWAVGSKASIYWHNATSPRAYDAQNAAYGLVKLTIMQNPTISSDLRIAELERSVNLNSVISHREGEFWAVGDGGIMVHQSNAAAGPRIGIQPFRSRLPTYYGIWGSSENDHWVVGTSGAVLRLQGEQTDWQDVSPCRMDPNMPPAESVFLDVGGTGPDDVWIVGSSSRRLCDSVYHWDGQRLCAVEGMPMNMRWVAASKNDVYLISELGGILHAPNTTQLKCK